MAGGSRSRTSPSSATCCGRHPARVSLVPIVFVLSAAILGGFVWLELAKSRARRDPLFEFAHLRFKTYRYGLLTVLVLAMGQLGLSFVLPIFLQDAKHLTAARNGLWMLPSGLFVIVGAQLGGLLIRRFGTTTIVRVGLVLYAVGHPAHPAGGVARTSPSGRCCRAWPSTGAAIGFAGAQLTNVILSEIPLESSGVASGANSTVRQVGSALGVSVIGSLLTVQTISAATSRIRSAPLAAAVKRQTVAGIHSLGSGYSPPRSLNGHDRAVVAPGDRTRRGHRHPTALVFAAVVVGLGALLSLLIPSDSPRMLRRSMLSEVESESHRCGRPGPGPDRRSGMTRRLTPAAGRPPVKVVTVSAAYGAGGTGVARLLAQRLRLPFADRLTASAGPSGPPIEERATKQELDEEPRNPVLEGFALLSPTWNMPVTRDPEDTPERLRDQIEQSIQVLLDRRGAVILGRGGAMALSGYPGAFHVRLDGPPARRARRGAAWEGVDLDTAKARLIETDTARAKSLRRLYGKDPSDPALYHLVVDGTAMAVDDVVELIAAAAEAFWRYDDSQLERDATTTRARLAEPQS